jgi:hypothetical protein
MDQECMDLVWDQEWEECMDQECMDLEWVIQEWEECTIRAFKMKKR